MTTDSRIDPLDQLEALTDEILAAEKAGKDAEDRASAREKARSKLASRERARLARDPQHLAAAAERLGAGTLASAWRGCPGAPDLALHRRPVGFGIDAEGVWFTPVDNGRRQFVCTPAVPLDGPAGGPARFAVAVGASWREVDIPRAGRAEPGNWVATVVAGLAAGGLKLSRTIDLSSPSQHDVVPASEFVGWWLLGTFRNERVGRPWFPLNKRVLRGRLDLGDQAARLDLAQALGRQSRGAGA